MYNLYKKYGRVVSFILLFVLLFSFTRPLEVSANREDKIYTMEELSRLDDRSLVKVLSETEFRNIQGLFSYSDAAYRIYGDERKMDAIRNALVEKGRQYTEDDDKGIPTLVEFLRSGYYLGFYNEQLNFLIERENKDKCIPAILSIQNNPNDQLGTEVQDEVVRASAMIVSNASSNPEVVRNFTPILKDFNKNLDKYSSQKSKGDALFSILSGVQYDLNNYTKYENRNNPEDSPWFSNIDSFIEEVGILATIPEVIENSTDWIINNGIYTMATLGNYHSQPSIGNKILTQALNQYEKYSEQYLRAALGIEEGYKGIDINGNEIKFDKLKEEAKDIYYGKTYTFDNGHFIIKAGDRVREDKIMRLYWAAKEVEAQFFRSIGTDKPLEEGNPDDVLTMIIYNNPKEYVMNNILNGLDTENGGMYIEGDGTFYTYERTKQDSIYTLEELFRHEFTHYLQGRYVVPGMWGASEIYNNDRLTWYEEGGAEYFAGSTRTEGVKPRKAMVGNVVNVPLQNRYSVSDVLNSKYSSGFDFYNYGYMFMDYINGSNPEVFDKITKSIMKNDIGSLDSYVANLKNNKSLNREYEENMQNLIDNFASIGTPLVWDKYLDRHEEKNPQEILREVEATTGLENLKIKNNKSEYFETLEIEGSYNGKTWYQGEVRDKKNMDKIVDKMLLDLSELEWSGYNTFTAYFKNYRIDENNNFVYDVVFHGIKSGEEVKVDPGEIGKVNAKIDIIGNQKTMEYTRFVAYNSRSENGDIVSYSWEIDGKKYDDSYVDVLFEEAGNYRVKLIVKDELGVEDTVERTIEISKREEPEIPVENKNIEQEPNDLPENANELLNSIEGTTNIEDTDWFYFDIKEKGYYEVGFEKISGEDSNFLIYREGEYDQYIYYADKVDGNILKSKEYYYPGRYYIRAYGFSETVNQYKIDIK